MYEAKLPTVCNIVNVDEGCSTVRVTHLNLCELYTQNAKWVQFTIPIGMSVLHYNVMPDLNLIFSDVGHW